MISFCFVLFFPSLFYSYSILFHRFPTNFLLFLENICALAFELSMFSRINKPLLFVLVLAQFYCLGVLLFVNSFLKSSRRADAIVTNFYTVNIVSADTLIK